MANTDELTERIKEVYTQANKELTAEWQKYQQTAAKRIEKLQKAVDEAKTPAEKAAAKRALDGYKAYATKTDERYKGLVDNSAKRLTEADKVALGYINGELPNACAGQYTRLMEGAGAALGVDFAIQNEAAIKHLLEEDRRLLPYKELDDDVATEWHWRHIDNAVAQAIIQGDSVDKLAQRLQGVTDMGMRVALRNARTIVNGAENAGRRFAQKDLQRQGTNLRKRWSATLDERVRDSHAALDGETVNTDAAFSNGLMYPGDPNGAPAEVYNCRCRLETVIEGFEPISKVFSAMDAAEVFREYEEEAPNWVDEFNKAREQIKQKGYAEEQDIHNAGAPIYDEYYRLIDERLEASRAMREEAKAIMDSIVPPELATQLAEITREREALIDKGLEKYGTFFGWDKELTEKYRNNWAEYRKVNEEIEALKRSPKYTNAKAQYNQYNHPPRGEESAQMLKDVLGQLRIMGGSDAKQATTNNTKAAKVVQQALNYFPEAFIERSIDKGLIEAKTAARGYQDYENNIIALTKGAGYESNIGTAIHELAHRFEKLVSIEGITLNAYEYEFYSRRTQGEELVPLRDIAGKSFAKNEVTRLDNFVNAYMGKDYNAQYNRSVDSFEINSMGTEYMYTNPEVLRSDKDMAEFILGILALGE